MKIRQILKWGLSLVSAVLVAGIAFFLIIGCRALFPKQVGTDSRLDAFPSENLPLTDSVTIYWNDYLVPFIVAKNDTDLSFCLGLFHGHFRESQLEVLRKISQGRIAEMAGPVATEIDAALRRLDYGKATAETLKIMDPTTRDWLQSYVRGINFAIASSPRQPPETALLGLDREPFTTEDLLTFGRLVGTDVNWLTLFTLLSERDSPYFPEILEHINQVNMANTATFGFKDSTAKKVRALPEKQVSHTPDSSEAQALLRLVNSLSRSGSNTVALAPEKTADGYALIASDPHLGQSLPNFWTVVGMKSPSHHAVGLMIPGLPFLGLGRNEDIAWGGTNMRAASSDFVDVTDLPVINERQEIIQVRFWPDRTITVRETEMGPILSDADLFPSQEGEDIALRWMGHRPSDEISAFLQANRAKSVPEFLRSFSEYAVSGQNMVSIDRDGNIGMVLALAIPSREKSTLQKIVNDPSETEFAWTNTLNSDQLPKLLNPESGFIVSANNMPVRTTPQIGYLFNGGERINRLSDLIAAKSDWTVPELETLQNDVFSPISYRLASELVEIVPGDSSTPLIRAIADWDGNYYATSEGAVAFELWLKALVDLYPNEKYQSSYFQEWSYLGTSLPSDIRSLSQEQQNELIAESLKVAEKKWRKYPTWGDLHTLRVGHLLAAIPGLGRSFIYDQFPASGSRETVYKTAHSLVDEPHTSRYGSQSRHISSMADLDDNWFVLFGGQDGWIGSDHFADQIPLWRKGEYMRIPLKEETVAQEFSRKTILQPK